MRGTSLLRAGINSVCSQVSFFRSGHDRVGVFHISWILVAVDACTVALHGLFACRFRFVHYTLQICVCVWVCFFRHVVLFTFRVCHCGKYPPQTGPAAPCRDHWACSVRPGWGARCAARPPTGSLPLSQNIRAPWRAHCWCPWTDWGWSHLRERSR